MGFSNSAAFLLPEFLFGSFMQGAARKARPCARKTGGCATIGAAGSINPAVKPLAKRVSAMIACALLPRKHTTRAGCAHHMDVVRAKLAQNECPVGLWLALPPPISTDRTLSPRHTYFRNSGDTRIPMRRDRQRTSTVDAQACTGRTCRLL